MQMETSLIFKQAWLSHQNRCLFVVAINIQNAYNTHWICTNEEIVPKNEVDFICWLLFCNWYLVYFIQEKYLLQFLWILLTVEIILTSLSEYFYSFKKKSVFVLLGNKIRQDLMTHENKEQKTASGAFYSVFYCKTHHNDLNLFSLCSNIHAFFCFLYLIYSQCTQGIIRLHAPYTLNKNIKFRVVKICNKSIILYISTKLGMKHSLAIRFFLYIEQGPF